MAKTYKSTFFYKYNTTFTIKASSFLLSKCSQVFINFIKFGTDLSIEWSTSGRSPSALMSVCDTGSCPTKNSRSRWVAEQEQENEWHESSNGTQTNEQANKVKTASFPHNTYNIDRWIYTILSHNHSFILAPESRF